MTRHWKKAICVPYAVTLKLMHQSQLLESKELQAWYEKSFQSKGIFPLKFSIFFPQSSDTMKVGSVSFDNALSCIYCQEHFLFCVYKKRILSWQFPVILDAKWRDVEELLRDEHYPVIKVLKEKAEIFGGSCTPGSHAECTKTKRPQRCILPGIWTCRGGGD